MTFSEKGSTPLANVVPHIFGIKTQNIKKFLCYYIILRSSKNQLSNDVKIKITGAFNKKLLFFHLHLFTIFSSKI